MKLGVDARMLVGKWAHRGIGRYILSILNYLDYNNILAFIPKGQKIDNYNYVSSGLSFFPLWEQFLLPFYIRNYNLSFFLYPSITAPIFYFRNVKKIFVVYDLIFLKPFDELHPSKSIYNNLGRIYRRIVFPLTLKSSDYIISISEYTKWELNEKFKVPLDNIHVIPCSLTNDWFVQDIIPSKNRDKYFISVTGDAPSKNLNNLLMVFSLLKKENKLNDFKLRLVGIAKNSKKKISNVIKSLNLKNDVILENFLSESDLQDLYRNAWASLTLSLYEGFGVPIIESMASGTPVICSNTTSLPEVAGGCALLVNPRSINEIKSAIIDMIKLSEESRSKMSIDGLFNAMIYSESNVSKVISDFWKKIV